MWSISGNSSKISAQSILVMTEKTIAPPKEQGASSLGREESAQVNAFLYNVMLPESRFGVGSGVFQRTPYDFNQVCSA